MSTRPRFEGREIVGNKVVVSGASADLDDPEGHKVGTTVYLVVEAVVDRAGYDAVRDSDKLVRVDRAKAVVGAIVERSIVEEAIEIARMSQEAKAGIQRLGFDDGEGS